MVEIEHIKRWFGDDGYERILVIAQDSKGKRIFCKGLAKDWQNKKNGKTQ